MSTWRVRRRGALWGVQELKPGGWLWRWWGPYGDRKWRTDRFSIAVWFADLCDRVDSRAEIQRLRKEGE